MSKITQQQAIFNLIEKDLLLKACSRPFGFWKTAWLEIYKGDEL